MPQRPADRPKARPDASRQRVLVVAVALVLWMLLIGARLVHLQVAQHDWLSARALSQQQAVAEQEPLRGLIVDRTGRELARSVQVDSFFAVPGEITDPETTAHQLSAALGLEAAALAARLRAAQTANRRFVWIARKVERAAGERVRALNLPGVHALQEPLRRYPHGALAAHILGFVDLDEGGLAGVERYYNAALTGAEGRTLMEGDARRRSYESTEIAPRPGQRVTLTIDQTIQHLTEQALNAAVERSRARSGTVIVLDPRTGEILALANAPAFDPNDPRGATAELRRNEALQNIYEPGSTFKIVAFAAALEEGLAQPDDRIDCQMGGITVAGRRVRDHTAFGTLTLTEALAKSSNVAAIKLGLRVGNERMYDYITRFGFGARTGVELPGETAGLLRPVRRWHPTSMGSIAIGQEIGVTPLQMVASFAAVANDGVRIAPHLVREIHAADGSLAQRTQPEARRVISAETARTLRGMLETVTVRGTARGAQLDGYTAAGKTGTAQKIDPRTGAYSRTKHIASFVGFAPVEHPAVVIIVVIDEPVGAYHGGQVAAPVFREIAEGVLPYMSVTPDIAPRSAPNQLLAGRAQVFISAARAEELAREMAARHATLPEVAPARAGAGAGEVVYAPAGESALLMPDLRGVSVRDAALICARLGLQLEARGEGRALQQRPAAGASVEAGQTVRVDFGRSD